MSVFGTHVSTHMKRAAAVVFTILFVMCSIPVPGGATVAHAEAGSGDELDIHAEAGSGSGDELDIHAEGGSSLELQAGGGRFALAAVDSEGIVIAPCMVNYSEGDTIKQALKKSGHEFGGIDSDWINTIDGHTDNYVRYYDGGSYDLNMPAQTIKKAFFFTTAELDEPDDLLALVKVLAEHPEKPEGMKKYAPVKAAYETAYEALPTAGPSRAKKVTDDLLAAYAKYEAWEKQNPCDVTIKPMQSGTAVSAKVTVQDTMDNVYEKEGSACTFQLREETYDFTVTKGSYEVSGKFTVSAGDTSKSLSPVLPSGSWFGPVKIRDDDKVDAEMEVSGDTMTAYILDTTYSPYITIAPGEDIPKDGTGNYDTSSYTVFSEHTSFHIGKYYGDESVSSNKIPWESSSKKLIEVIESGVKDKTVRLKVVHKDAATGYTQRQYRYLTLRKIPTIKKVIVKAGKNKLKLTPEYSVRTKDYTAETIKDTVSVSGLSFDEDASEYTSCGKYKDGYSVEVNGTPQPEDGAVDVPVTDDPITITVKGTNGLSSSCRITVHKTGKKTVTVNRPSADTQINLITETGSVLEPDEEDTASAKFFVGSGSYSWVTTKEKYYHASGDITVGNSDISVTGAAPVKEKLLDGIGLYSNAVKTAWVYQMADGKTFSWDDHEYAFLMSDFATSVYAECLFDTNVTVTRESYRRTSGYYNNAADIKRDTRNNPLSQFVRAGNQNNSVVFTASKKANNIRYYQDYHVTTRRYPTLSSLSITDKVGNPITIHANGDDDETEFDEDVNYYTAKVGETSDEVCITCAFSNPEVTTTDIIGDQTITIGDRSFVRSKSPITASGKAALDKEKAEEVLIVKLSDDVKDNPDSEYRIKIIKVPPVSVRFSTTPKNATIYVTDDISGQRIMPEEDGSFGLLKGFSYTYTATCYGYVGKRGKLTVTEEQTVNVDLAEAARNDDIDRTLTAEWPYFRADANNNGVVDIAVPKSAGDTVMYWAKKIGAGYSSTAAGCPIIADGYIYTYSGNKIVKLDPMTGEIAAEGEMVTGSAFAINSPTYAEGMIFVGLNNGKVQAFNAKTLESLWVYTDVLGGQPNCQITYNSGYIYTGYWNSETKAADFVCLSVTDEDPLLEREEKLPVWVHRGNGFYWAGSYASDDYVLVGSDDGVPEGTSACGILYSLDPLTGVVLDSIDDKFVGDIRSSICYDTASGRFYFTSKTGQFCSVKVNKDGTFNRSSITTLQLTDMAGNKGMSTSTPVVYNGRAYVGVSGTGQFSQYTGHNITVIDLEGSRPVIAYKMATQGYPQTSGLLTTAYEKDGGAVYVYFFDNFTPGKLRLLKDKPGQTEADPETTDAEEYEVNGVPTVCNTASVLFTPYGDHAQYAICSPIVDEWGNIYFKNDSAYMMKIGAKITELKVTKQPDRKDYITGDIFDPEGMEVTATFANGKKRDVTKYVKFLTEPLTKDDTEIQILFDTGDNMSMYQNKDGEAGVKYFPPETSVSITVTDGGYVPTPITEMTLSKTELEFNGENLRPEIASINGLTTLKEGEDYTVSWPERSVDPGTYTVKITGKGRYTGSTTTEYTIKKSFQPVSLKSMSLSWTEAEYTGQELHPEIALINGTDKLKLDRDYTVKWPEQSVNVGQYTVTVTGIGNYTGTLSAKYEIKEAKKLIELTSLELMETEFVYDGTTKRPGIRRINGSSALVENKDYTVKWPDESIEPDTYTVTVTGMGEFTGEVTAYYTIKEPEPVKPIESFDLTKTEFEYNGEDQRPEISLVNDSYDLEEGMDYLVTWPRLSKEVGTYEVTLTGIGAYEGTVTMTYRITPARIKSIELSGVSFVYNGKKQLPLIESVNGSKLLTLNVDYTVTWPAGAVNAGTYEVNVTGKGSYTGTATEEFTIEKAAGKVTVKPAKKTIKAKKKFLIKATSAGGAKITFKVTKGAKFVKLVKKGKKYYVQGKKKGKAVITVTAAATKNYKKATKKINVTVKK